MGIRSVNNSLQSFLDTFLRSGADANPPTESSLNASGGIVSEYTDGAFNYKAHVFYGSANFTVTDLGVDNNVEYFLVGGGGGAGGGYYSGGGGGGGVITNSPSHPLSNGTPFPVGIGSYSVVIGGGGGGGSAPGLIRNPGNRSTFAGIVTAYGGGAGGSGASPPAPNGGDPGGSGGGGAYFDGVSGIGNSTLSSPPQGNNGGEGSPRGGGGGGGAGGIGTFVPNPVGSAPFTSNGGIGTSSNMTGISTFYAAGGAGCFFGATDGLTTRASGIGGRGATDYTSFQTQVSLTELSAIVSTGSGGGGIDQRSTGYLGSGSGSSGVVVVRYKVPSLPATAKASGGLISYYGGKTVHTFTSTGIFVAPGSFNETLEVLLVAGGGGGGFSDGPGSGGGGGGGVLYTTTLASGSGPFTYTVTVGSGGAGGTPSPGNGVNGGNTTLLIPSGPTTYTADGGGGGARGNNSNAGSSGGSGGGGTGNAGGGGSGAGSATESPSGPFTAYGFAGGNGYHDPGVHVEGGGGGGAGGAGGSGTSGTAGPGLKVTTNFGGPGVQINIDGNNYYWAAGGGGGGHASGTSGYGGLGGGGGGGGTAQPPSVGRKGGTGGLTPGFDGGSPGNNAQGGNAGQNTGSGGGGSANSPLTGGSGGSGIVIIAYPS